MLVKIFRAYGGDELAAIERQINGWLDDLDAGDSGPEIVSTQVSMCSVGNSSDMYQCVAVFVWYKLTERE